MTTGLTRDERRTLESVRHNVDFMWQIMANVRAYLDNMGLGHVPLNTAEIDRLTTDCHRLIDRLSGRDSGNGTTPENDVAPEMGQETRVPGQNDAGTGPA